MPNFPYVPINPARVRKDPLGPQTLNQLHENIEAVDQLSRVEHLNDGTHNALEVPWVLGHIIDGAPPTGALFNTAYGGSTFTRPVTGAYTFDVASGLVTADSLSRLQFSALANPVTGIESKPRTTTIEATSATSFKVRQRELSTALGVVGNAWADVNGDLDIALHAKAKTPSTSLLTSRLSHRRNEYLTEQATDWNALVQNQATLRKAALVEHDSAGAHTVNRIAKAMVWVRPTTGPAYSITASQGVSTISRVSLGVIEVTLTGTMTALTTMSCFVEGQPSAASELIVVNGKAFSTGAGTTKFRFYCYLYDLLGPGWTRVDRPFFAVMFGA